MIKTTTAKMTTASLYLLIGLVENAENWSGCPLLELTAEECGNYTQLKKLGICDTIHDDNDYVKFYEADRVVTDGKRSLRLIVKHDGWSMMPSFGVLK